MLITLLACRSESTSQPPAQTQRPTSERETHKPNDEMDEKMRHCPLALEGASTTLDDIDGGVRFTIRAPTASIDEIRRRAHHIVEFAAKRTREGHGEFDGKGGGHMKNCPVITDGVTITATDIADGAQLDVSAPDHVERLRAESRARAQKFPFAGATVSVAAKH